MTHDATSFDEVDNSDEDVDVSLFGDGGCTALLPGNQIVGLLASVVTASESYDSAESSWVGWGGVGVGVVVLQMHYSAFS